MSASDSNQGTTTVELYCFSDESERAYGSRIYFRSANSDEIVVRLARAKSRVAPIKTITNSTLKFESKHPIILPSKHHLTTLIIRDAHNRNLHAGPQLILPAIRRQY